MTRLGRNEHGVAMIEMVIVTPLLLFLILGVSELGQAFVQYNTLTKGVRDGARQAAGGALLGTTGTVFISPEVETETKNLVVYGNAAGTGAPRLPQLDIGQVAVSDAGNNMILVQVDYAYDPLVGSFLESFGLGAEPSLDVTLTASAVMRAL